MKPLAASRKRFYIVIHHPNQARTYLVHEGKGSWPYRTAIKIADEFTRTHHLVCSIHC